jgi:single-stranded-DNA-specific exonuclease
MLRERMERHSAALLAEELLAPPLECDVEVGLDELTPEFYGWLERCGPYGVGHREPVLMTRGAELTAEVRVIKERHVCLDVTNGEARFSALGWSRGGTEWSSQCREMGLAAGGRVDLAYRLKAKTNPYYPGLELELVDLRPAR